MNSGINNIGLEISSDANYTNVRLAAQELKASIGLENYTYLGGINNSLINTKLAQTKYFLAVGIPDSSETHQLFVELYVNLPHSRHASLGEMGSLHQMNKDIFDAIKNEKRSGTVIINKENPVKNAASWWSLRIEFTHVNRDFGVDGLSYEIANILRQVELRFN